MNIFDIVTTGLWIAFMAYWAISARGIKKNARNATRGLLVRLVIIVVLLFVFRTRTFHRLASTTAVAGHPVLNAIGVVLCALGIGIAVWARRHIGRNWGMPMSVKEKPELVTTGPYAHVRHPIYSGILLAMLGSALATGIWWLCLVVVFGAYFIYAASMEERTMTREFPDAYPDYQRKSKMLIPWR
jgi:protein-S-isoprenylcysteine O-methyltransferase Ste14